MTNLGLIEVTRTRIGPSLHERLLAPLADPASAPDAIAYAALRTVIRTAASTPAGGYRLALAPIVADALEGPLRAALDDANRHVGQLVLVREADRRRDRFDVMLGLA